MTRYQVKPRKTDHMFLLTDLCLYSVQTRNIYRMHHTALGITLEVRQFTLECMTGNHSKMAGNSKTRIQFKDKEVYPSCTWKRQPDSLQSRVRRRVGVKENWDSMKTSLSIFTPKLRKSQMLRRLRIFGKMPWHLKLVSIADTCQHVTLRTDDVKS